MTGWMSEELDKSGSIGRGRRRAQLRSTGAVLTWRTSRTGVYLWGAHCTDRSAGAVSFPLPLIRHVESGHASLAGFSWEVDDPGGAESMLRRDEA